VVEQPIRKSRFIPRYSLSINVDDVILSATVGLILLPSLHFKMHHSFGATHGSRRR
jgi:hypothetical protein